MLLEVILSPSGNTFPLTDIALQDFFHNWIAGIMGIANDLVRPRWQPEEPNIPDFGIDWCAFGITEKHTLGQPYEEHIGYLPAAPNGYSELRSHQEFTITVTFYGPNAEMNEMLLSRGLYISQNQEILELNNMAVVGHGDSITIPELLKEQWMFRVDLPIYFRRQIILDYPILNILKVPFDIDNEYYNESTIAG